MDTTELKTSIETYLRSTGHAIRNELTAFADWVDGGDAKAKEQTKNEQDAAAFLRASGWTVTEPVPPVPAEPPAPTEPQPAS